MILSWLVFYSCYRPGIRTVPPDRITRNRRHSLDPGRDQRSLLCPDEADLNAVEVLNEGLREDISRLAVSEHPAVL